jgi:Nodulation protein Z (NodZ)
MISSSVSLRLLVFRSKQQGAIKSTSTTEGLHTCSGQYQQQQFYRPPRRNHRHGAPSTKNHGGTSFPYRKECYWIQCALFTLGLGFVVCFYTMRERFIQVPNIAATTEEALKYSRHHTELDPYNYSNALNKMIYTGSFGFGHRMSKLSAAVHLMASTEFQQYISIVHVDWGTCRPRTRTKNESQTPLNHHETVEIFAYLFNSTEISIPGFNSHSNTEMAVTENHHHHNNPLLHGGKVLRIRNDVAGYYAGQSYKNSGLLLNYTLAKEVYNDKLRMDYSLYQHLFLSKRFIGFHDTQLFQEQQQWGSYFVIGVHVRAGNGEQHHFASSQRNDILKNEHMIDGIALSIQQLYHAAKEQQQNTNALKPPIVFLATDTEIYIDALRQALFKFCSVVIYDQQPRVPPGQGVSYETEWTESNPNSCLRGWYGAAIDMILLSQSDVLIATSRSTFTQIVPASILFHRVENQQQQTWRYCEMDLFTSSSTTTMTCFRNQQSWLFRDNKTEWHTFHVTNQNVSSVSYNSYDRISNSTQPVAQKLMVHLPDISTTVKSNRPMYLSAIDFFKSIEPRLPNETLFYYGKKYNSKYRRNHKIEIFRPNWTWL